MKRMIFCRGRFCVSALSKYIRIRAKKIAPTSIVINYPVTDENLDDVKPFAEVNDAAHYVQTLRQQTWNRNA